MYLILKFRLLNMHERQRKVANGEADRQKFQKWRKNLKKKRKKKKKKLNLHAKNARNPIIPNGFCYATNVMTAGMPLV